VTKQLDLFATAPELPRAPAPAPAAHWSEALERIGACGVVVTWARTQPDYATAWTSCTNASWLIQIACDCHLARDRNAPRLPPSVVAAACACVRLVIDRVSPRVWQHRFTLDAVEAALRGEVDYAIASDAAAWMGYMGPWRYARYIDEDWDDWKVAYQRQSLGFRDNNSVEEFLANAISSVTSSPAMTIAALEDLAAVDALDAYWDAHWAAKQAAALARSKPKKRREGAFDEEFAEARARADEAAKAARAAMSARCADIVRAHVARPELSGGVT
jgi:hypothetical protein